MEFSIGRRRPDLTLAIEGRDDAPRQARRSVLRFLDDPDDPIADSVTLVVSELVANVVIHAHGIGRLDLWDPKPGVPLRVEVSDLVHTVPTPRHAADTDTSGRGLNIVRQLADTWGIEPTPDGKTIWAEFSRLGL